jgi:hypothetical protein
MYFARPLLAVLLSIIVGSNPLPLVPAETVISTLTHVAAGAVESSPLDTPRLDTAGPDLQLDVRGGVAARAHVVDDGVPVAVPGDVFVLMGAPGSERTVRVYDRHPHLAVGAPRPETERAFGTAAWTVERLLGREIERHTLTYSDGGGDSGGLAYVISYLNLELDGGFTADVRVAATGRVLDGRRVREVEAVDEKTMAAHGAGVDTVFVPVSPSPEAIADVAGRALGEPVHSTDVSVAGADGRWDRYVGWGATRSSDQIDIVVVHYIGDVAAYLCGAGSAPACDLLRAVAAA